MTVPHILVVDDNGTIRRLLTRALARQGYDDLLAVDGQEALRCFAAVQSDVVVLDLDLSGLPVWEVCRLLKARSAVPIVIMTGDAQLELVSHWATEHAAAHLIKPFPLEHLFETLQEALGRERRREAGWAA